MRSRKRTMLSRAALVALPTVFVSACSSGGDAPPGKAASALAPPMPSVVSPANADPAAWVTQVVPLLLGRPVRSFGELKFLSVAVARYGQRAVAEALMNDPAFVERWTGVMLDRLQVAREDSGVGLDTRNLEACYREPVQRVPDYQVAAAQIVLHTQRAGTDIADPVAAPPPPPPPSTGSPSFNMADVVRGAIRIDNMFPAYRGHLFAMVTHRYDREDDENRNIGDQFNAAFLNKSAVCMQCHSSNGSCSAPNWFVAPAYDAWPRGHEGRVGFHPLPTGDIDPSWTRAFQAGSGATVPFAGMSSACGTLGGDTSRTLAGAHPPLLDGSGDVTQLDAELKAGYLALDQAVASGDITSGAGRAQDGRTIGAYWMAVAFTNDIWREVFGDSLTIANFGYRNQDALGVVWSLAEQTVIQNHWSLTKLLAAIVTSQYFNRVVDATPRMPKVFEPFLHPGYYTQDFAGDAVHRRSADLLFRMKAQALDWRRSDFTGTWVTQFPSSTQPDNPHYPSRDEAQALSMYLSRESPSAKPPMMSQIGMLGWEASAGKCDRPADIPYDWIDGLADRAAVPGITVRDAVEALKYRLLGRGLTHDPSPSPEAGLPDGGTLSDEEAAIEAFVGRSLGGSFAGAADANTVLRNLCSVFVKTPQFMLEGASPEGEAVDFQNPPRLLVGDVHPPDYLHGTGWGLDDDGPVDACNDWSYAFQRALPRRTIDCSTVEFPLAIDWTRFCVISRCYLLDDVRFHPLPCPACVQGSSWLTDPPPVIDPRAEWTPPPNDPARTGMFLLWTETATIDFVGGQAQIVRAAGKIEPVVQGAQLAVGDGVELWPGAELTLTAADGKTFATPPGGMPKADGGTWFVMAMGQKALPPPPQNTPPLLDPSVAASAVVAMRDAQRNDEPGSTSFLHTVTAPAGNSTYLDDPLLDGNPNAIVLVSQVAGAAVDDHAVGVWYTGTRWAIYNEDGASMPVGAAFAVRGMNASATAFVHRTTASNVSGHVTYLDDGPQGALAGNAYVALQVTHVWNAPGLGGVYDNHPTSVYYDGSRWALYHDDFAPMPIGAAFTVKLGGSLFVTASAATRSGNALVLDDPSLNGVPTAKVFAVHSYDPPGAPYAYATKRTALRYDTTLGKWTIGNLDGTAVTDGVSYNVHRAY